MLPWILVSLTTCAIVTTGIVYDLLVIPILNDDTWEEHATRTIKAFTLFALLEMVSSVIILEYDWTVLPFIILCFGWGISTLALYTQYRLITDGSVMAREETFRRANIIRAILWVGRFVCLFILTCIKI